MSYQIELVSPAEQSLDAIPDWAFIDVDNAILSLAAFPNRGILYNPIYKAARPPKQMRVLYVHNYGINYTVDDTSRTVHIRFIEDQRMDPKTRFRGRLH